MASIASFGRTAASLVASSSRLPRLPASAWILSTAAALPSTYAPSSGSWYAPLLPALERLGELFPPILMAVPKHKVTHSRKSMRSANKGLHNKTSKFSPRELSTTTTMSLALHTVQWLGSMADFADFSHCEACGSVKLAHNVCPNCYSQISRRSAVRIVCERLLTLQMEEGGQGRYTELPTSAE